MSRLVDEQVATDDKKQKNYTKNVRKKLHNDVQLVHPK